jgi:hypothetical protein
VKFTGIVTVVLLFAFVWFAYRGHMLMVISTWDFSTWALVVLSGLFGWVLRNEFDKL